MFLYSLKLLSEIFLILRRIKRDMIINVHTSSCKVPVILVRFYSNSNFRKRLSKSTQTSNFMKIRPVGAELFRADRRTDMATITVAFRNIANVPKTSHTACHCERVSTRELLSRVSEDAQVSQRKYHRLIRLSTARRSEHGGSNSNASDITG